jgi:TfoX/Sxy family transcriptional regulator of competence genes
MAFDEKLANRAREIFYRLAPETTEKAMFGGLCFMVDEKMCTGIVKEDLMLRLNPDTTETVLEMDGCRSMDFTGKSMKGFVYVSGDVVVRNDRLEFWIRLALEYNPLAKATKKKTKPTLAD